MATTKFTPDDCKVYVKGAFGHLDTPVVYSSMFGGIIESDSHNEYLIPLVTPENTDVKFYHNISSQQLLELGLKKVYGCAKSGDYLDIFTVVLEEDDPINFLWVTDFIPDVDNLPNYTRYIRHYGYTPEELVNTFFLSPDLEKTEHKPTFGIAVTILGDDGSESKPIYFKPNGV
jgi:hypothetical protein